MGGGCRSYPPLAGRQNKAVQVVGALAGIDGEPQRDMRPSANTFGVQLAIVASAAETELQKPRQSSGIHVLFVCRCLFLLVHGDAVAPGHGVLPASATHDGKALQGKGTGRTRQRHRLYDCR